MSSLKAINLGVHFLLELAALAALVYWGFTTGEGWLMDAILGLGIPLLAAIIWGVFRVPDDPGPATVAVPGYIRLIIEWGIFGLAGAGLFAAGARTLGWVFLIAALINYAIMYERVLWLLRQR